MRIGGWIKFVFDELLHLSLTFGRVFGQQTAYGQIGDAVAVHIGKGVVGSVSVDFSIAGWTGEKERLETEFGDQLVVFCKQQHGCRRDGPVVVSIQDVVADGFRTIAATFCCGDYFGENALLGAELFQGVGPSQKILVVKCNNEIFAAFLFVSYGFVEPLVVMRLGQHVAVDDQVT